MENYDKYPRNIFKPEKRCIRGVNFNYYKAVFRSLTDLYNYLKSEPKINREIFTRLASERESYSFSGREYEEALEMLVSPVDDEYADFLTLQKKLDTDTFDSITEYETYKSASGGVIDIPSYVTGSPLCYLSERETYEPKFVRMNVLLSYYCGTSKNQVRNRALIVTSLVNALEKAGYIVDMNAFSLCEEANELLEVNVNIKSSDESLNKANLIKALCYVEFLRRIIFRVRETMPVKNEDWGEGYGKTCSRTIAHDALKLSNDDLFIDQPSNLNIKGYDLLEDFNNTVKNLKLADKIDLKESRKNIQKVKKLIL